MTTSIGAQIQAQAENDRSYVDHLRRVMDRATLEVPDVFTIDRNAPPKDTRFIVPGAAVQIDFGAIPRVGLNDGEFYACAVINCAQFTAVRHIVGTSVTLVDCVTGVHETREFEAAQPETSFHERTASAKFKTPYRVGQRLMVMLNP